MNRKVVKGLHQLKWDINTAIIPTSVNIPYQEKNFYDHISVNNKVRRIP
jgi:hypothetical protein